MSRDIDSTILSKLAEGKLRPFHLIDMIVEGVTFRRTNCDGPIRLPDDMVLAVEDITLRVDGTITGGGTETEVPNLYTPNGFSFQPIKYSVNKIVDKATVEMPVVDDPSIKAAFIGGTPKNSQVIIRGIIVDDDYSLIGDTSVIVFEGNIDNWSITESKLSIGVSNLFVQWTQKALRRHSSSCTWKVFGGATPDSPCFYSGEETRCDRSHVRCAALGNTVNFGGFRWLPSIVDKEIWWGREAG